MILDSICIEYTMTQVFQNQLPIRQHKGLYKQSLHIPSMLLQLRLLNLTIPYNYSFNFLLATTNRSVSLSANLAERPWTA